MKTSLVLPVCCLVAATLACPRTGSGVSGSGSSGGTNSKAEKIAQAAESEVGSTLWSKASSHKVGAGEDKCNIFVAEMIERAGAKVPHRHWLTWSPIGAGEWGNPSSSYLTSASCWKNVFFTSDAKRGDIISDGVHVGIVTGASLTTSATSVKIITNDWGFRASQNPTLWRYTC